MFKPISQGFSRKTQTLLKTHEFIRKFQSLFTIFLSKNLPSVTAHMVSVTYDNHQHRVVLQTTNKSIANELAMRLDEILKLCHEGKLAIDQIIIR